MEVFHTKSLSISFMLIGVFLIWGIHAESKEDFLSRRDNVLKREKQKITGGDVQLNEMEKKVDKLLMCLKDVEFKEAQKPHGRFAPSEHFFKARQLIEEREIFKIIRRMPKGAALHVHDYAMADIAMVIKTMTYDPNCYLCIDSSDTLQFRYFSSPPVHSECNWMQVNARRNMSGNPELFDRWLYSNLSMVTDDPIQAYPTQNSIWKKFMSIFVSLAGIVLYQGNFGRFYYESLESFYSDNVQYVEMRTLLGNIYELNGTVHDQILSATKYRDVTQQFVHNNPDFFGAKIIFTSNRGFDKDRIKTDLQLALSLLKAHPDFFAGYDLVAHEDAGHPLKYFIDDLLLPSQLGANLRYFFHAGETDWYGVDTDINIIDALLLNTSRIGHGYAITKHPVAMAIAKERGVALEVNPISNQVLGYVSDLRNHPATALMAEDFPVVISSDDPSLFGSSGLSYDFYEAFMGLGGRWADLRTLKTLALNSIRYSATSAEEKEALNSLWNEKWETFIAATIEHYRL